jgi:hypothetical protein
VEITLNMPAVLCLVLKVLYNHYEMFMAEVDRAADSGFGPPQLGWTG